MAEDLGAIKYTIEADTSDLSRAENEMDAFTKKARSGTKDVDKLGDTVEQAGKKSKKSIDGMSGSMDGAAKAIKLATSALAAFGAAISVREIVAYSDAWQSASNQLRLVTNGTEELTRVQGALLSVANDTRSSFESTANLFSRLTRATSEMGLSQKELLDITTTINQSFAVSGATAAEASAAITQLSQGLAAGALRGDEFNSVAEQAPGIMRAIADSLKMTTGELRSFAADGGITADIVVTALQQASGSIANDFGKSVQTFGQSMQVAKNNMLEFVGSSEAVTDATQTAGRAVIFLSDNIDTLVAVAGAAATIMAARVASSIAAAGAAAVTATAGMASLSSAMALLGGPVGIAVLASVGVYKLVDAYMDHNEAAKEVETAAFLAQNGIHLAGAEFEDVVSKIDKATQSLRDYVEAGGALSGMIEKGRQEAAQRARDAIAARNATVESTARTKEQIVELRKAAVALDHGAFSTAKKTEAVNDLIDSLSKVRLSYSENIAMMKQQTFVMQGVTTATEKLADTNEDTGESAEDAARVSAESWGRTHEFITNQLMEFGTNGKNAWESLADTAVNSIKRIAAEWAASKIMGALGIGGGGASAAGGLLGGLLGGGGGIGGIAGKVAGAASAIPGWGLAAAGGAALLAGVLGDKSTPSGNAGFLIRQPSGGGDGRTFDVPAFASGFDPVGFARREDQAGAVAVIDTFRQYDAALTQIAGAAGLRVNYNSNNFGGFSEKGTGGGLFFGTANEDGRASNVPLDQQLTQFVGQWVKGLGGQVDQSLINEVLNAGSADAMVARAAALAGVDGSHAGGLNRVPFDGYIAELHKGERVQTASEARVDDMGGSIKLEIIKTMKRLESIIQRWDFDGLPPERA